MEELSKLQEFFSTTYLSMLVDCKYEKYDFMIKRQRLAGRIRDKWILIHGWIEDKPA